MFSDVKWVDNIYFQRPRGPEMQQLQQAFCQTPLEQGGTRGGRAAGPLTRTTRSRLRRVQPRSPVPLPPTSGFLPPACSRPWGGSALRPGPTGQACPRAGSLPFAWAQRHCLCYCFLPEPCSSPAVLVSPPTSLRPPCCQSPPSSWRNAGKPSPEPVTRLLNTPVAPTAPRTKSTHLVLAHGVSQTPLTPNPCCPHPLLSLLHPRPPWQPPGLCSATGWCVSCLD